MAEFYPTVSFPYYNFAVCCLIFSEGEFLPYGILSRFLIFSFSFFPFLSSFSFFSINPIFLLSYGDPVTYNRSLLPNDLPSACQESNFGFFEGRMGGVNGPVTVLAPDDSVWILFSFSFLFLVLSPSLPFSYLLTRQMTLSLEEPLPGLSEEETLFQHQGVPLSVTTDKTASGQNSQLQMKFVVWVLY